MGKRLLIFAIIFLSLLAFTIWRAQPPFRLQRKLLAKLPYAPENLLITDLDDDGHPEVMAFFRAISHLSGFASRLTNLLAFALKTVGN
jgi:hypothetical protein